jgi:hypothetical protein
MDLGQYIEELKQDCVVDEINLKESSLLLPAKKAKWVARLILQKNNLSKLEKEKKELIQRLTDLLKEQAVVTLSVAVLKNKAEQHERVLEIDAKIQESKNIIDFLERVEKIMSSMSFDIGNIIKIVQLETT